MDNEDDFEMDPAIAAAMGFSGFGPQANKKRKFNDSDGFVDPGIASAARATGANSLPTREIRSATKMAEPGITATEDVHLPQQASGKGKVKGMEASESGGAAKPSGSERPSLEALRYGVANERGDLVYFLPSFLEDPWAELKPQ